MRLIITIPAYNEEATISKVIDEIPKKIKGIDEIEVLVIDDGSTDNTAKIAEAHGAEVIRHASNLGLAKAFRTGLYSSLEKGAGIILNTDADFQYNQKQIPLLLKPILEGRADIVLGSRFKGSIEAMPIHKKLGNILASRVLSFVTGYKISDGQTGFRAFSRESALRMNLWSDYTYTHETLLHAAENSLVIEEVPVDFRKRADKSRLISSIWLYAFNASKTLFNYYLYYKPLQLFGFLGAILILSGLISGMRVLVHFFNTGLVSPYIPTAVLTSVFLIVGFILIMIGLVADLVKHSRKAEEEIIYLLRK